MASGDSDYDSVMDSARRVTSARLARLRDELLEEGVPVDSASHPTALVDEIDYAVRPPRHERRMPAYGAVVLPDTPIGTWSAPTGLDVTISPAAGDEGEAASADARRYADGRVSFTVRCADAVESVVVFDRSAGSERDLVVLAEATGGYLVQRRADGLVRVVGSFGVARWESGDWHIEPPFGSWLERASWGLDGASLPTLDRLLRFAVHDLGSSGIGALLILGAQGSATFEQRLSPPPPLHVDRPSDLGPLRHVLSQVDGAALFDSDGTLRSLGLRLVPSAASERSVAPTGGTRHTAARRYSADEPDAVVVAVSESGPVTVFRRGEVIGRSDLNGPDPTGATQSVGRDPGP